MVKLGELQERILKHFFDCKEETPESVNHLSRILGVSQPAVFKSVKLLINEKYLQKDPKYREGKKYLIATDKGAAAAVALGISYGAYTNYVSKLARIYGPESGPGKGLLYLDKFEKLLRVPDRREFLVKKALNFFLMHNYYEDGVLKRPSPGEMKMLLAYLAVEYNSAFGYVRTIKDLIDKYGLDKEYLKSLFEKDRKRIDSILKQLE